MSTVLVSKETITAGIPFIGKSSVDYSYRHLGESHEKKERKANANDGLKELYDKLNAYFHKKIITVGIMSC